MTTTRKSDNVSDGTRMNGGMLGRALVLARRRWDLSGAIVIAGIAFALETKEAVRHDTVTVLLAAAAAGLAVLSVVLGAMAVFATFFDSNYRRVLEAAGGMRQALVPYLIVAGAGAVAAVLGVIVSLAWPVDGWVLKAALSSATIGVAIYAILGALSLVELTIFHAKGIQARKLRETKAS